MVQQPGAWRMGRFPIEEEIGRSANAVVYRGTHPGLRVPVTIKLYTASATREPAFSARFKRETAQVASLAHPDIIRIFDSGLHEGSLYIVTESVVGATLRTRLAERRRLSEEETDRIVAHLFSAVGAVHELGIVHGHLKPENVLVGDDGSVRIVDFGVSQLSHDSAFGSGSTSSRPAAYLAPEQVAGQEPTAQSDIYALGAMIHEMLDGQPPFTGPAVEVLHAHLHVRPAVSPRVPVRTWPAIATALAKDPRERHRSCAEFASALLGGVSREAPEAPAVSKPAGFAARLPLLRSFT